MKGYSVDAITWNEQNNLVPSILYSIDFLYVDKLKALIGKGKKRTQRHADPYGLDENESLSAIPKMICL